MTPHKLGRYEIVRVLGKGAMGIVYEGRDPNLDRRVAIKTVKVENLGAETAAEYEARFRTEARSAGRLQHPNIVSVYDAARDGDTAYLVMEFIHGDDLKNHIDKGRRYSLDETARIVFDLLAALAMAHQHNIVHRDIKPANLLIEKGGRVKLTDFGVARIQNSGEATRTRGGMIGTLKYMAPEQVQGLGVDSRADLFSAGVVLYQLLTDRRPFDADTDFAIMHQVVHVMPEQPSHWHPGITQGLNAVVAKALAKNRDERFQTADEFDQALRLALRDVPDTTIVPPANPLKVFAAEQAGLMTGDSRLGGGTTGATATGSVLATSATSAASSPSSVTQELELVYWKDVRDSTDADELLGFLTKFPTGIYADLAKKRLKRLTEPQTDEATRLASATRIGAPPAPGSGTATTAPAVSLTTAPPAPGAAPTAHSAQGAAGTQASSRESGAPNATKDIGFATTLQVTPSAQELAALGLPAASPASSRVADASAASNNAAIASGGVPSAKKSAGPSGAAGSNKPNDAASALWLNTSLYAPDSQPAADAAMHGKPAPPPAPISPTAESSGQLKSEGGTRSGVRKPSRKAAAVSGRPAVKKNTKWKLWAGLGAALGAAVLAWNLTGAGSGSGPVAPAPAEVASQAEPVASGALPTASDPAPAASSASASAATASATAASASLGSAPVSLAADPALASASAADSAASAASAAAARVAASAAARVAASSAAARARDAARRTAAASAPAAQPVDVAATTPASPAPVPAPAVTPPASRPAAVRPAGNESSADPKQSCEGRVLLGYFSCITEQCQKPQYARHPTCVEWREAEARRKREAESR